MIFDIEWQGTQQLREIARDDLVTVFKHYAQSLGHRGYREFLEVLDKETGSFEGEVMVVHGDSHNSRVDHYQSRGFGQLPQEHELLLNL